jgi:hypothetical protein
MKKQQYFALTGLMPQGAFNFKLDHPLTSNGKTRFNIFENRNHNSVHLRTGK